MGPYRTSGRKPKPSILCKVNLHKWENLSKDYNFEYVHGPRCAGHDIYNLHQECARCFRYRIKYVHMACCNLF